MTEPEPVPVDDLGTVLNEAWTPLGDGIVDADGVLRAPPVPIDLLSFTPS